jgi:WD40 repeat protein
MCILRYLSSKKGILIHHHRHHRIEFQQSLRLFINVICSYQSQSFKMRKQALLSSYFLKNSVSRNQQTSRTITGRSNHDDAETTTPDNTRSNIQASPERRTELDDSSSLKMGSCEDLSNTGTDDVQMKDNVGSLEKNIPLSTTILMSTTVSDEEQNSPGKNGDNNLNELSEYEKLRLRNIKRNHERLVSLGLVDPSTPIPGINNCNYVTSKPRGKKQKQDKIFKTRVKTANVATPLRRSARNRGDLQYKQGEETVVDTDILLKAATDKDSAFPQHDAETEKELFQDSPLVQYSMECKSPVGYRKVFDGPLGSLVPVGPRLLSPQSNLALYSLDIFSKDDACPHLWVVGAGKSGVVSIWNCQDKVSDKDIDPIISWKAHSGRWIADALFVPQHGNLNSMDNDKSFLGCPSKLLTAANDGTVSLWDLKYTSCSTGAPKNIATTGKSLHQSGIFSMHIDSDGSNYDELHVCTGSKDKTLAVTALTSISSGSRCSPFFVSTHHSAKVACVKFQGRGTSLVGSASDDGSVAIHDYRRMPKVVANIDYAHTKPHSIVWSPSDLFSFITAGYDDTIYSWDFRHLAKPIESYSGHVSMRTKQCKRIHRPCFLSIPNNPYQYILSGSENSGCLSIFHVGISSSEKSTHENGIKSPVYRRGSLPNDCGDVGCMVSAGMNTAIAVDGGDVLLLEPTGQ